MEKKSIVQLIFGDRIYCWSGIVKHYGVYTGDGWVLHNLPEKDEHIVPFENFREARQVFLEKRCDIQDMSKVWIALRTKTRNPQKYDLINHNCEHTAMEVTEQRSTSTQVNDVLVVLGISALVFLIVQSKA